MKANLIDIRACVSAHNNPYFLVKFQDTEKGIIYSGYWMLDWESTQKNLSVIVGKKVNGDAHHLLYKLLQQDEINRTVFLNRFVKNPYEIQTRLCKAFGTELVQSIEVSQLPKDAPEIKAEENLKKVFSLNRKL